MDNPENEEKGSVNLDKLVTRLLDIIQNQQAELSKARAEPSHAVLATLHPPSEEQSRRYIALETIQHSGSAAGGPAETDANLYDQRTFLGTVRQNLVFIVVVAVIAIGLTAMALKPSTPQIAQLTAEILRAEETVRSDAQRESNMQKASDEQIVDLQNKLAATEHALSENERALLSEQEALRIALTLPNPSVNAPIARRLPTESLSIKESINATRQELANVSNDIDKNKRELLATLKTLGLARLALARERLDEQIARGLTRSDEVLQITDWESYLVQKERAVPANPIEMYAGSRPALTPLPPSETDLKDLASSETSLLGSGQNALRLVENRIKTLQTSLTEVQDSILKEHALVLSLRNHPMGKSGTPDAPSSSVDLERHNQN